MSFLPVFLSSNPSRSDLGVETALDHPPLQINPVLLDWKAYLNSRGVVRYPVSGQFTAIKMKTRRRTESLLRIPRCVLVTKAWRSSPGAMHHRFLQGRHLFSSARTLVVAGNHGAARCSSRGHDEEFIRRNVAEILVHVALISKRLSVTVPTSH